ncbi:MAG: tetratricopeptide repeat protein [Rhodospirillaceae bacterium]|jgi:tetratricopeptide (TPR) repeat protein|nr:tetratricopeptide repeat protein [Rhodospirillaceae bacterium]MBT5245500.1 tetratricopeptide repeat protein [Rhodospirillaceae bacterium]MBT5560982.1 tetratricopeptide repeat protein [Rhodospirillaceae bacterium]MBT6240618.1 tetratricopeptide repeat protein [Rhodospirillaceae bacterium]MBT7137917.1 tetratricopeptide repeat protein [Rhodospirillaceae bacterium]
MGNRHLHRRYKTGLIIGLTILALGVTAVKAEPVKVRAATHEGYGRIVFNWSSPGPYKVETNGGQLVVSFGRAIEPALAGVVRNLSKYLSSAAPGADGQSVVFGLKDSYEARGFDMGAAVVVDIVEAVVAKPATAEAAKPQAPAPTAAPVEKATRGPAVNVRSGVHTDFTRIVFDWPNKVPYRLEQAGGTATIIFSRPAQLAIAKLQRRPPKLISAISSQATDGGVSVTFSVDETSRVRDSLSGSKVIVDVMKPTGEALPKQVAQVEKKAPEPAKKEVEKKVTVAAPAPAAGPAPVLTPAPAQSVVSEKSVEKVAQVAALEPAAPAPAPAPDQQAAIGKPTALTPPDRTKKSALSEADQTSLNQIAGIKILDGSSAVAAGAVAAGATGKPVKASAVESGADAVGIRIDWDEPVAAAVFRRAGYLWIVFDKNTTMNIADLKAAGGNIIRSLEQVPNENATLLRLATVSNINPTMKRDGLAWIMEFRQQPIAPTTVIDVTPQPNSPIGARLFLSITEPGNAIVLTDPAIGDTLVVVPVIPLGYGIAQTHDYPQARILASSQGLVIQPRADDLRVRPLRQGVEVTNASGLQISPVAAALAADAKLGDGLMIRSLTRLFDLDRWRQANLDTFEENKWKYQMAAATASSSGQEKARMDVARFYFANGFGAEALGVLKIVAENRPEIAETEEFRGLRGAINVLMARYDDAREDLHHESLDKNDEARFWRATLQAYEGDLYGAAADLRRMAAITRPYPRALKIPLETLIADAAIQLGDIKQANRYLEAMRADNPNPAQSSEIDYVEGRLLELSGDFDGAVGKWEEVQEGPHRPSRAKAAVARTELLLKLKQIDDFEAIIELEKLRFAWRGGEFEFELLRRLGDLYVAVGDYRNGLRTMRQAATHFRDNEKAPEVTQQMTDAFAGLYLDDKADDLAPITAIALYDEFKELTPPGEKGDEMIRRLADRLVDVDLLDRASALLQGQVEFRLEGVEKARVGAQLALVHILAHEYEQAIQTLDESDGEDLPEELAAQRQHLRARSLMGQERIEDALALLKDDKSLDADLLRQEIFWNEHDWVQASQILSRLLRTYEAKAGQPLDDLQGGFVLNQAIAMTLSGNERGIDRLRRDFGVAMDDTQFRDAFRLIASPQTLGLISFSSIAGKVADVENFQTFMDAYQERLNELKLSAIN